MSFDRRKVIKALNAAGFAVAREGGSHTILGRDDGVKIAVPRHRKLKRGTVRGIAEDAGLDWSQFRKDIS